MKWFPGFQATPRLWRGPELSAAAARIGVIHCHGHLSDTR